MKYDYLVVGCGLYGVVFARQAADKGKKVLIIDLDLYSGDIASSLNLNYDNDIYNLFEDLNNNKFENLDDYACSYNDNIKVIAAPKDPRLARKITSKVYMKTGVIVAAIGIYSMNSNRRFFGT